MALADDKRISITELRYLSAKAIKKLVKDSPVIVEGSFNEEGNGRTKLPLVVLMSYDMYIKWQEVFLKGK